MKTEEIKEWRSKFERRIQDERTTPEMRAWYRDQLGRLNGRLEQAAKKRKYNAIYRARRGGVEVDAKRCTIYRAYGACEATGRAECILLNEYQFGIQLLIN